MGPGDIEQSLAGPIFMGCHIRYYKGLKNTLPWPKAPFLSLVVTSWRSLGLVVGGSNMLQVPLPNVQLCPDHRKAGPAPGEGEDLGVGVEL